MTTFSQTGGIGITPKRWTEILTVRRNRAAILPGSLLKFVDEKFTGAVLRIKLSCGRFAHRSYGFLYQRPIFTPVPAGAGIKKQLFLMFESRCLRDRLATPSFIAKIAPPAD